jgi:hypothetical protein
MPKDRAKHQRHRPSSDELIRHHLEEAVTHLGMVKQLINSDVTSTVGTDGNSIDEIEFLHRAGKNLKRMYVRHGGHPDA